MKPLRQPSWINPYGGCNVGRTLRNDGSAPDVIQLEAGEYKLNSEIIVESHVNILGKSPFNYTQRSPITFLYPIREALTTTISGQGKTRLFNTVASQASMVVNGIILKDGYAAKPVWIKVMVEHFMSPVL